MHKLAESKLMAGFIYGDPATEEYVYLPGSEVGTDNPVLIYECEKKNFIKKDCGRFYPNRSLFT